MPTWLIIFLLVFGVVGLVVVFGKNARGGGSGDGGCNAWWFDGDNDGDGGGSDGGDGGGCGGD